MNRPGSLIILSLIILAAIATGGCEKYDKNITGEVEFYLLTDYNTIEGSSAIDTNGMILSDEPILTYDELMQYNSKKHTFDIRGNSIGRVADLWGSAFAVVIEDEPIYTGYFWSALSSATIDWVIIDVLHTEMTGELKVTLGYPGLMDQWSIPDKRNDNRILSIFARDGKMKD